MRYVTYYADGSERDLNSLSIGDKRCADMAQAELFRAIRNLVPGLESTMGKQELLERLCAHYSEASA
jgi:hypothetical protein